MLFAIDGSTVKTGYAHGGPHDPFPKGGVWKLPGASELGGVFDHTLANVGRSIMENCRVIRPRAVYIEAPMEKVDREHSAATAMALIQLAGAMRMACALVQCRVELCATFNVRKAFGVDPFLRDQEAKAAVMTRLDSWGWTYQDDNEADAKLTWAYGMVREFPGWKPNQPLLFEAGRVRA